MAPSLVDPVWCAPSLLLAAVVYWGWLRSLRHPCLTLPHPCLTLASLRYILLTPSPHPVATQVYWGQLFSIISSQTIIAMLDGLHNQVTRPGDARVMPG